MILKIVFYRAEPVYHPGEAVTGEVIVNIPVDHQNRGLKVTGLGLSTVHWADEEQVSGTVNRHASEVYYQKHYLAHGDSINENMLEAGEHVFPFHFSLPEDIPGSFHGAFGVVRHSCTAKLIGVSGNDITCKRRFSVNPVYDLNEDPVAKDPIIVEARKKKGISFLKLEVLSFRFQLDHRGFVCGEPILIDARIYSRLPNACLDVMVELLQTIHYICPPYKQSLSKSVGRIRQTHQRELVWTRKRLQIPTLPPSKLPNCRHIDIEYSLKFSVTLTVTSSITETLTESVPITIGTVPLSSVCSLHFPRNDNRSQEQLLSNRAHQPSAPSHEEDDSPPAYSQLTPCFDIPPPSYHQSMAQEGSSAPDEDDSDETFSPVYATYNFPSETG